MGEVTVSPSIYRLGLVLVILLAIGLFLTQRACQHADRVAILEANLRAGQDSLRIAELRNGQLEYARRVSVLSGEISTLQDQLERVGKDIEFLSQIKAEVKIDTLKVPTIVERSFRGLVASWQYGDPLLSFTGSTNIANDTTATTTIQDLRMHVELVSGLRQLSDDHFEFFVRPTDPRVSVDMEGLIVNRERFGYVVPKRWVISVGAGYGIGSDGLTPFVGVFVGRKLHTF